MSRRPTTVNAALKELDRRLARPKGWTKDEDLDRDVALIDKETSEPYHPMCLIGALDSVLGFIDPTTGSYTPLQAVDPKFIRLRDEVSALLADCLPQGYRVPEDAVRQFLPNIQRNYLVSFNDTTGTTRAKVRKLIDCARRKK